MQPVLPLFNGPQAPQQAVGEKDFEQLKRTLKAMTDWAQSLTLRLNSYFTSMQTAVNDNVQFGSSIPSGSTISISASFHHITGTATINTITAIGGLNGVVFLLSDGTGAGNGFSIGASGNIAIAGGPYPVGRAVPLVFDQVTGFWYPVVTS